jgi:hypothetical protein
MEGGESVSFARRCRIWGMQVEIMPPTCKDIRGIDWGDWSDTTKKREGDPVFICESNDGNEVIPKRSHCLSEL